MKYFLMKSKVCSKCGKEFPATTKYFYASKLGRYGLRVECKGCSKIDNYNRNSTLREKTLKIKEEKLKEIQKQTTKVCSKCKTELPKTKEYFTTNSKSLDGYHSLCRTCHKQTSKLWKEKNKEALKWRTLYKMYGISKEEYLSLFQLQENKCAICGKIGGLETGNYLVVDHNHDTGKIRGLLCSTCNTAIGVLYSIELLDNAKEYIKENEDDKEN